MKFKAASKHCSSKLEISPLRQPRERGLRQTQKRHAEATPKEIAIMSRQTQARQERFYLAICAIMEWKPTPLKERILEDAAPSVYRRHQYKTHPS